MAHKFKLGQQVRRTRSAYISDKADFGEIAEIVRLMPADRTGEPSYRIRSGFSERAVREDEIIAAS